MRIAPFARRNTLKLNSINLERRSWEQIRRSLRLGDGLHLSDYLPKQSVQIILCVTHDLEVPANADFVIEGCVDPSKPPRHADSLGDHTGHYTRSV